jgi:hypothetical protein
VATLQEIESQVAALSKQDLAAFCKWLDEFQADAWDKQIENDSSAGRLDKWIEEVRAQHAAGNSSPL